MQGSQQTLSVEDYTRFFVKKIVKDEKYRDSGELYSAGMTFYSLLQRFAREGDREDVRTPFKIMKDEFMNEWRASTRNTQDELIRRLFGVLDIVHEECQSCVQNSMNGSGVSYTILEEFRLRLMKMVVGDTWKEALPLRIEALKHMHKYRNRELDGYYTRESRKNTLKHRARNLTVKKLKRTVVGPAKTSWTAVFNDLLLTSGSRLAPLLFAILDENQTMEDRLLSIAHPRSTDTGSQRGSMVSVKSGSSASSNSLRMPSSEADTGLAATDEDGPYYFKNLNSELNAKLQLFKQRGLTNVMATTNEASQENGDSLPQNVIPRLSEEESSTAKSDDIGNGELHMSDNGQRSLTPFLDESPPPWCLSDVNTHVSRMHLSDGDEGADSPIQDLKVTGVSRPDLRHAFSQKTTRTTAPVTMAHIMKSPSCRTSNAFSFTPHVETSLHPERPPHKPQPCAMNQTNPFGDLDPLNSPELKAFNKP